MPDSTTAIFVAVNDNHRAWYEMLIPFVLSLRATDYDGRVVVLGYGLAPEKVAILEGQAIEVVAASGEWPLPLGRYIEVARFCAAHPAIAKAALYDADLWFCSPRHDLFPLIDGDRLHVCPDPLFCQFVISPLIGPRKDENWRLVVTEVLARYGHALQAGLVAGSARAWGDFARHVGDCVAAIGTDFQNCFGADTTFLHLWAATNEVVLLPRTQNFITRWGVAEIADNGVSHFAASPDGEAVRALHMAGNVRFFDRWRFYGNHPGLALEKGRPFALTAGDLVPMPESGPRWDAAQAVCAAYGLRLTALRREAGERGDITILDSETGLTIACAGNAEIAFEALTDIPGLNIYMSHPSGYPSPVRRAIACHGNEAGSHHDLLTHYRYSFARGVPFTLSSSSLGGQLCKSIWFLSDKPDIEQ